MATTGEKFPTSVVTASESPWMDNDWTSGTNVTADDGATAYVTAASFDSPDQTYVLKAYGFDFSSIPNGSTIDGVICRVNAWYRSGQGSGSLDLCQLLNTSLAKVGTNHCATPVPLTTDNATIITEGGAADKWGNALDAAWVKNSNFGVALGILATAANADVDIDYVTLEIYYTPPAQPYNFTANGISTDSPVLGSSTLGQKPNLLANGIATDAPVIASSTLSQKHIFTASNIVTDGPVLAAPTITINSQGQGIAALFLTGYEYGVLSANGEGLARVIGGNAAIQSSIKHSGSYALRCNPSNNTSYVRYGIKPTASSPGVLRFYIYFTSLPAASASLAYLWDENGSNPYMRIRYNSATQNLSLYNGSTNVDLGSVTTGIWYRIDAKYVWNSGTLTVNGKLDGGTEQTHSVTTTAVGFVSLDIGVTTSGSTCDLYIDDIVVSGTASDYPIGAGETEAISPSSDGTHNAGTNVIEAQDGTDIGVTTAYDKVNSLPIGNATTYVKQSAIGNANYAEVNFADTNKSTILGAEAFIAYESSGATANTGGCIVIDEDTTQTELHGTPASLMDYSEISIFYDKAVLPKPSGGWDQAAVNALKARFGYSNNVTSVPYWVDLIIEVAYVPSGGYNFTASNISTDAPVLGQPTIGQKHILTANNVQTGNPVLGTPTIGQTQVLTANNIETGNPVLGTPTIGQKHILTANNIETGNPILGSPTFGIASSDLFNIRLENDLSGFTSIVNDAENHLSWSDDATAKAICGTNGAMSLVLADAGVMYGEFRLEAGNTSGVIETRFHFDRNSLAMADDDGYYAFRLYNSSNQIIFEFYWRRIGTDYMFHTVWGLDSGDTWAGTHNLTDLPHSIEIKVERATTALAGDGHATVWIDGEQREYLTGDNYDRFYDFRYMQIGADGVDAGTTGTIYYDEIRGNDTGDYIGPYVSGEINLQANDISTGSPVLGTPTLEIPSSGITIGNVYNYTAAPGTQNFTIPGVNVPSNATACILICMGYWASPGTPWDNIIDSNFDGDTDNHFSFIQGYRDSVESIRTATSAHYLLYGQTGFPTRGSNNITFTGRFSAIPQYATRVILFFLSGTTVTPADFIIGTAQGMVQNWSSTSLGNITPNDLAFAVVSSYQNTVDPAPNGSGQTVLDNGSFSGILNYGVGYEFGEDVVETTAAINQYMSEIGFAVKAEPQDEGYSFTANGIATGSPVLEQPSIGQIHALTANNITTGSPVLGVPTIGQKHILTANGIVTGASVLGQPTIGQKHILTANGIVTGASVLGQPTISINEGISLVANGIVTGAPTLAQPTIGQKHILTASEIATGSPVLGVPTIGQKHILTANGIVTDSPVIGQPIIGQKYALTANGIVTGSPILAKPTIGQKYALTANTVVTGSPVLGQSTIGQKHILQANGIVTGSPVLGTPTLIENEGISLVANDIVTGAPILGQPTVRQVHILQANGIVTGSPVLGKPTTGQIYILQTNGIVTGSPVLGKPTSGVIYGLTANGINVGSSILGKPTIGVLYELIANWISTASPILGKPGIGQIHILHANAIVTGSPVCSPVVLRQIHVLIAGNISTGVPVLGKPEFKVGIIQANSLVLIESTIWSLVLFEQLVWVLSLSETKVWDLTIIDSNIH